MKSQIVFAVVIACLLTCQVARAETFVPTSGGPHFWNVTSNWSPPTVPDSSGATAVIPAPTGDLTIDLGDEITVGSLTVIKSTSADFDTTITGTTTNKFIIDGGASTFTNESSTSTGGGLTTVAAPVELFASTFTVTQRDDGILQFTQQLSGAGALTVNRSGATAGTLTGVVELNAANTYAGATTFSGGGSGNGNYLIVRLNHADAIPSGSNITLSNSAVLELASGNFMRSVGTGAGQIQFSGGNFNGFAAFGADRTVNLSNDELNPAQVSWTTGTDPSAFGQLTLGVVTSDAMVDFRNPIDLGTGSGARSLRSEDGTAPIDGRISGSISSATRGISKVGSGVLSLAAENTYAGDTTVSGGMLRLDHADALPSGNLTLTSGGALGLGAGDFSRNLGTGTNQVQFTFSGGNGNAGFSAHGANRTVVLNGSPSAGLTWAADGFVIGNLLLSHDSADSMVDFQNPINLNGAPRTVAARNGSAAIDAKLSGVISGTGLTASLIKTNPGTLELSAANTYEGTTTIDSGVLLLTNANSIPGGIAGGNSNTVIIQGSTGVIGLGNGDFTSGLGVGQGKIQFAAGASGGFAAYGADRVVNLGGNFDPVTWGVGDFVSGQLLFSALGSADAAVDFQNPIDLAGAQRTVGTRDGTAAVDGILSGVISGAGGILEKQGGGTLVLTGANTYDGGTLMNEGRLLVNNTTGSGVGTGDVTVNAGTFGGSGFIGTPGDTSNVTVNNNARLAPGNSPGELTVFGDVTFSAATTFFDVELASIGFDTLTVNGAASLNGTLNVSLLDGYTPAGGTTFEILSASSGVSGTFSNVVLPSAGWQVTYNATSVVLTAAAAGLAGDFNNDNVVDAADYVIWRKFIGTPEAYNAWRANFGNTAGSGSGGNAHSAPEPTAFVLSVLFAPLVTRRRNRRDPAMVIDKLKHHRLPAIAI
ncbi:MAG: autotransporter-associated beta strand repeat-containing protein [Pirellulales bacterium]